MCFSMTLIGWTQCCSIVSTNIFPIFTYFYTTSGFCYDKHQKNFDIHISMKRIFQSTI